MTRHKRKRQFEKDVANRYVIEKLLGEGGFCVVFKAVDVESGHKVAIKRMDKTKPLYRKFQNPKAMDKLNSLMYREADVMRSLEHKNIISLLNFIDDGVHIYLILEFAEGGELYARLLKSKKFKENIVITIMRQVIDAVKYMHDSGYIHRDIKAENILFKERNSCTILLTDFGLSKATEGLVYTNCGTLVYSAPELLRNKEKKKGYDKKVDNWAIGILTYLLLSGHLPFDDPQQNDARIKNKIMKGKISFPYSDWNVVNVKAKGFILKLLEVDPRRRMELSEALQHGFLYDPKELYKKHHEVVKSHSESKHLELFPMMESSHLDILAKIRWKVLIYLNLTVVHLKLNLENL